MWSERIRGQQAELRAEIAAQLLETRRRALEAAEWDRFCEQSVLFSTPQEGAARFGLVDGNGAPRQPRLDQGFRGSKVQALTVALKATEDLAKLLGLVVEKQTIEHDGTESFLEALRDFGARHGA